MQYDLNTRFAPVPQPTRQKKKVKPAVWFILSAGIAAFVLLLAAAVVLPAASGRYGRAASRVESGDYAGALKELQGLWPPVRDASSLQAYAQAGAAMKEGRYDEAKTQFGRLGKYRDSEKMILEADYLAASAAMQKGDYAGARKVFEKLSSSNYKDSAQMLNEADYQLALALLVKKDYKAAQKAFKALGFYKDSPGKLADANEGIYLNAVSLYKKADYKSASAEFTPIEGYNDNVRKYQYLIAAHSAVKDDSQRNYVVNKAVYDNLLTVGDFEDAKDLKLSDAMIPYYLEGDWLCEGQFLVTVCYDWANEVWFIGQDAVDENCKLENKAFNFLTKQYQWAVFFKVTYRTDDSCEWYLPLSQTRYNLTRDK